MLCIAGKGYVNQDISVGSETLVIIPKGIKHDYMSSEDSPWYIYWVHFQTDEGFLFNEITLLDLTKEQTKRYMDIFVNMIGALSEGINQRSLSFNTIAIKYMMGIINNQFYEMEKVSEHTLIKNTKAYVLENLASPISIEYLCTQFGVSKSRLFKLYSETFGLSPHVYFTNLKLDIASNYLLITSMTIKQIALSLGYEDPYYFSRVFKNRYGLSPKHFRKENLSGNQS